MICRKCKKEIAEGSAFCNWCGTKQTIEHASRKRANGMGTVYKDGDRWRAISTKYEGGKRYTKSQRFDTRKDANTWLATVAWSVADRKSNITFEQLYDEWSAIHYEGIVHKKENDYKAARKACSALDHTPWSEITLRHMQQVVNDAKDSYYVRKNIKTVLNLMGKFAIDNGYCSVNVAGRIKLPAKTKPHKEAFSEKEIELLWKDYRAGNQFTAAILIMIYTGMRYGEITTIKPENVFLDKGYLLGGIKSEAGKEGEIMIVEEIKPLVQEMLIDGGLPQVSDTTFRKMFNQALERSGCDEHTIHECRHTTATILAKAGIQPAIIKEIMRHSSYDMTLEYTHVKREDKKKAIATALHQDIENPQ